VDESVTADPLLWLAGSFTRAGERGSNGLARDRCGK